MTDQQADFLATQKQMTEQHRSHAEAIIGIRSSDNERLSLAIEIVRLGLHDIPIGITMNSPTREPDRIPQKVQGWAEKEFEASEVVPLALQTIKRILSEKPKE